MTSLLVDLDGALGDTRPLWHDWLADADRLLDVDVDALPADRGEAARLLDAGAAQNWRVLLERFAEDRAPVYLRPAADASEALRRLALSGVRIGVYSDAPLELARIALSQLGAARRVAVLEAGVGAVARLRTRLGEDAPTASTRQELVTAASYNAGRGTH